MHDSERLSPNSPNGDARARLGMVRARLVVESEGRGREYSRGDSFQVHLAHWQVLPCCSPGRP